MSPSIRTMGFFMSEINFCNTKEQLSHLGEVVTGKVDGSPSGADIDTSTLSYTGQVRKTLPALENEYDTSIANKEAEADAAIDEYRLLFKGAYAAGIALESEFEYINYNGASYFATNPPYTTTATTPDADGNLFAGGYTTIETVASKIGNPNLLSNHNFLTPSPDAITHPNATPESYVAGTQIFSGVYAGSSGVTVTLIDGRVNCSAGSYEYRVPNTSGLDRVPVFTSSVSDYDGNPVTTGVNHALVSDEYVITVTPASGDVFSVKFEQGDIATKHQVNFKSETKYARDIGFLMDGSDETDKINKTLNDGMSILMQDGDIISYSPGITVSRDGAGICGGALSCISDTNGTHVNVVADNVTINTKFIGNNNSGRGVVRVRAGVKGFKSKLIEFENFYSSSSVYMVPMWIETDGTSFDIDKLSFKDIKNLGDGVIGDDDGSIRLVNCQGTVDATENMRIGIVEFDDIFCVNAQGGRVREDADAVVTAGFVRIPLTIDLIKGRNIGKRCLKTQAKGLHCKAIHYTHTNQDVEHSAVFDQQDSDNTVGVVRAFGNIASFYRSLARDNFQLEGGGVDTVLGETSYVDPATATSAIGVMDVQAGVGLKFPNWNVKGGKLGVRLDSRNQANIVDILINGRVESQHSHYIRNLNAGGDNGVIDNISFGGEYISTNNDTLPGSDIIVQNGGSVGTIKYLSGAKIKSDGAFEINARIRNAAGLRISAGCTFDSSDAISLDVISVEKLTIVGISETDEDTSRQVLRLTLCGDGTVSDVTGSKVSGTSEGMVSVNGCDKIKFDNINNIGTGQDLTFKDSGSTENTNCYVDGSTRKVTAVSTYNETNLEWDGAPSYGSVSGAVSYVRRGFVFTDSTNSYKTYVWSGFNYVPTT